MLKWRIQLGTGTGSPEERDTFVRVISSLNDAVKEEVIKQTLHPPPPSVAVKTQTGHTLWHKFMSQAGGAWDSLAGASHPPHPHPHPADTSQQSTASKGH